MAQAVWQPQDETEIGLNAHWDHASEGVAISLNIAATDIRLQQIGDLWKDKLDIFLVQRDDTRTRAQAKEQTLALNMKPATYQKILQEGIPFAEYIDNTQDTARCESSWSTKTPDAWDPLRCPQRRRGIHKKKDSARATLSITTGQTASPSLRSTLFSRSAGTSSAL